MMARWTPPTWSFPCSRRNSGRPCPLVITGCSGERAVLNWEHLRTLDATGWDVGSHTVAETELPSLSGGHRM